MNLRWFWRWCPCVKCHARRCPRPAINMPKLLAMLLEEGFDIRDTSDILREDIRQTLGVVNDEFAERKSYSYGVFAPTGGGGHRHPRGST